MQLDSDPQVEPAQAFASTEASPSPTPAQNGQASLTELMAEVRAQTEEVLTQLAAAGTWLGPGGAPGEPEATVRVPLTLLEQVSETVSEARAALAHSRGEEIAVSHPDRDQAGDRRHEQGDDNERERARMVSLNMALNGAPPTETQLYLERNFVLADAPQVAAAAYARARDILSG